MESIVNRLMDVIFYGSIIFGTYFVIGGILDEVEYGIQKGVLIAAVGWAVRYIVTGKIMLK
jgi:hypothetical protein